MLADRLSAKMFTLSAPACTFLAFFAAADEG